MTGFSISKIVVISMMFHVITAQAKCCNKTFKAVKNSVLILSDDLVDANTAQEKCSLLGGNLAMTDDPQINTTLIQFMTDKYTADLQRVYIFYDPVTYERRKYSYSLAEMDFWKSSKSLGRLWYFDLYKRKRSKEIFNYGSIGSMVSSKLGSVNETFKSFNIYEGSFLAPNIRVLTGARYNTSLGRWYWSDGSPANFPVSNVTTCQQGVMHYGIGWEQSSMNCSGETAYYACQVKLNTTAETFPCNASTLLVSWTGLDDFIINNNLTAQVEIQVHGWNQTISVPYSFKSTLIEGLNHSTSYDIQVTVIVTGSTKSNITSSLTVTTPGNPPPSCYPGDNTANPATSVGMIAGLVIGLLLLVFVIVGLVIMCVRRRHRTTHGKPSTNSAATVWSPQQMTGPSTAGNVDQHEYENFRNDYENMNVNTTKAKAAYEEMQ